MSDMEDDLEKQQITEFFPNGLNTEQEIYINSLHEEISVLSQHIYEIQNNLAQWMVSQKAFKEAAIQIGLANGMRIEDIICKSKLLQLDVLDNKNNPFHGTNAKDSKFLESYVEILKNKMLSNK